MAFQDQILQMAGSQDWIALAVNMIVSTIIGGIVIAILLAVLGKAWKEDVNYANAFLMVLIINAITFFGIINLLSTSLPTVGVLLPLLFWVGLSKTFFSSMRWWHAIVVGLVGYVLSLMIVPYIVSIVSGFIPF